jgi:hypothetical protein
MMMSRDALCLRVSNNSEKRLRKMQRCKKKTEKSKGDKMSLSYEDLELFYKFCINRVDYSFFKKIMMDVYPGSEKYVDDKWPAFRNDPIGFIIGRREIELFSMISGAIEEIGYEG